MLNPSIGAFAMLAFSAGFYERNKLESNRITIHHLVTILPLVLNRTSRSVILKRRESSGLRSIMGRDTKLKTSRNEAIFNINKRVDNFIARTYRSINIAFAAELIVIKDGYFHPVNFLDIPAGCPDDTKDILKAAQKLGRWAGKMNVIDYLSTLGVGTNEA